MAHLIGQLGIGFETNGARLAMPTSKTGLYLVESSGDLFHRLALAGSGRAGLGCPGAGIASGPNLLRTPSRLGGLDRG